MHITTGTHVGQICMFLLTETRYFPASLLQSSPGRGQRRQSVGTYSIIDLDLSRYDQIAARFARERLEDIEPNIDYEVQRSRDSTPQPSGSMRRRGRCMYVSRPERRRNGRAISANCRLR